MVEKIKRMLDRLPLSLYVCVCVCLYLINVVANLFMYIFHLIVCDLWAHNNFSRFFFMLSLASRFDLASASSPKDLLPNFILFFIYFIYLYRAATYRAYQLQWFFFVICSTGLLLRMKCLLTFHFNSLSLYLPHCDIVW